MHGPLLVTVARAAAEEFMHGGHVAALVLSSIVFTLGLVSADPVNLPVLAISYLIPLIIYSYNYYEELEKDRLTMQDRTAYLERKARIYPVLISGYIGLLAALIVLYDKQLFRLGITVGILLIAGILYTVCLKRMTRYVPGFKSYFVSGEWAVAIVLMYAIYTDGFPGTFPLAMFSFVFLRFLTNAIFFDMKDIRSDGIEGLKTIPVILGWQRTIRLLYPINLLSAIPLVIGVLAGEQPGIALVLLVFTVYGIRYLRRAEVSGETGMMPKDYAIADYEFILWPWAVGVSLMLLDWLGPIPTAVIVLLIVLASAIALFARRGAGRLPPAESLP